PLPPRRRLPAGGTEPGEVPGPPSGGPWYAPSRLIGNAQPMAQIPLDRDLSVSRLPTRSA
ncbi:hypothetical protein, partial [Streptomyces malaysiensis]|uniref:hypothetical protein n=1 Tax=Streptomyces malaysiensis TaxID=92644 RepID=UPI0034394400